MTGSGNSFFFSLRQHKLLKVKLMPESFGNLHHLTPPTHLQKITHVCKLPLRAPSFPHCVWAAALLWAHPERAGQLPHLARQKNRENTRKFSCRPLVLPLAY